jgi:hypothetical protein
MLGSYSSPPQKSKQIEEYLLQLYYKKKIDEYVYMVQMEVQRVSSGGNCKEQSTYAVSCN